MDNGLFITFEGGEGSGKTTVLKQLIQHLDKLAIDYIVTREPGGSHISEQIRAIILDKENVAMDKRTEALLFAAARAQHITDKIKPALKAGQLVVCDRFIDSSIIYQGYVRRNDVNDIIMINNFAIDNVFPDLTIFFDIEPEIAFKRINNRELDRLDLEDFKFHEQVYNEYHKLAANKRFITVDATKPLAKLIEEVFTIIYDNLKLRGMCE